MTRNRSFDLILLPTKAYDLFNMLDNVKGQSDITSYEQNLCKQYTDFVASALQTYKLPFKVAIFDKVSLKTGLRQYNKLLDLISLVENSLGKGLNFTRLQLSPPKCALGETEFDEWINMAIASIQSLPAAKMVFGDFAFDTVDRVLFGKKDYNFSLPKDMIAEMDKWCIATVSYGSNTDEFIANRAILNSVPEKWKTLFEALKSSSDPYTDGTILNRAHQFADEFVAKYPSAMIAVDDIVTFILKKYKESLSFAYGIESKKQAKKRASFWTGFGIWAVLMGVLACFLFVNTPTILPLNEFIKNGFFANVGLTIVCIIVLFIVALIFAALGKINFLAIAPVLPRGACTMLCCYLVFASNYHEIFIDYKTPFNIFGVVCIIASLFYEFIDAFKESNNEVDSAIVYKWTGSLRGSVMFTTPLAIIPPALFLAFIWAMTFLHIIAIWIVMIVAIVATIYMVMGSIIDFFDL